MSVSFECGGLWGGWLCVTQVARRCGLWVGGWAGGCKSERAVQLAGADTQVGVLDTHPTSTKAWELTPHYVSLPGHALSHTQTPLPPSSSTEPA